MYQKREWVSHLDAAGGSLGLASTSGAGDPGACFSPSVCQEASVQLDNKQRVGGCKG